MHVVCLFAALALSAVPQQDRAFTWAGVSGAEQQILHDAVDGAFNDASLVETALIAAGRQSAERTRLLHRYRKWVEELPPADASPERDSHAQAAAVFACLHREILTGEYCATCSDVGVTLQTGEFNCLTATILFIDAARRHGVEVEALATEGHVFCQLNSGDSPQRVETTCAKWFQLAESGNTARARCPDAIHARDSASQNARPLSDVQLIAKVYYNRGVAHFRANEFPPGVTLTRMSLLLDPEDAIARGNLLAGLNNWALEMCRRAEFARGLELIEQVRRIDPSYPTLEENTAHIYRCWAEQGRRQSEHFPPMDRIPPSDSAWRSGPSHSLTPENAAESRLPQPRLQPIY